MSLRSVTNEAADASENFKKRRAKKPAVDADRLPPHAEEVERGVLGCVLENPDGIQMCEEAGMGPSWFYNLAHQRIYDACFQLSRAGVTPDLIQVQQFLKDAGQLQEIGGFSALAECGKDAPLPSMLQPYLDTLRGKWTLRGLLKICGETTSAVFENEAAVDEHVGQATKAVLRLSEGHVGQPEELVKDILPSVIDDLEHYHRGSAQMRGLSTGLVYLDKMTGGIGGEDNNMIVVAARPGAGKTSLALEIAMHVALDHPRWEEVDQDTAIAQEAAGKKVSTTKDGKFYLRHKGLPVGIFSLEMTKKALVQRMMFQRAGADAQRWRTGFAEDKDFPPLTAAGTELSTAKIWIDDKSRCAIDELIARARRMHRQYGIRLFIIDYIQLLRTNDRRFRNDRVQELAEISGELQKLGKELRTPFIILAQMNRDAEKDPNREPRMSDLKDCGAIEQDADIIGFLHRPRKAEDDERFLSAAEAKFGDDWSRKVSRIDLLIAKSRNGPTGPVQLLFQKSSMHFHDYWEWLKGSGDLPASTSQPSGQESGGAPEMPTNEDLGLGN